MKIKQLLDFVTDKSKFSNLENYSVFAIEFLGYISENIQAEIISQNETNYCFFQYSKEANFQITRPINKNIMLNFDVMKKSTDTFFHILKNIKDIEKNDIIVKNLINNVTYTIQQSIGACLDALPAGKSNTARKLNGDLFENFIRLILKELSIDVTSGVVQIPVKKGRQELFKMNYQHDLIIKNNDKLKLIGSVKTSSKDRIDKIFIDKFLYNKLTATKIPHIAIFLNDVQRKKTSQKNKYGINSTFLPGHFKGYSIKLNPLDGVYYCDIRPNMLTEDILKDYIKKFDELILNDIWKLIE